MALKTNAEKIRQGYVNACNAVLSRGGSINSGAPIGDLASAILNIPHDQTLAWHTVKSNEMQFSVPLNSEKTAIVKKVGGMTYKSTNILPFPYSDNSGVYSGVNVTVHTDRSITFNGTATTSGIFNLCDYLHPTIGVAVSLGAVLPSGVIVCADGVYIDYYGDYSSDFAYLVDFNRDSGYITMNPYLWIEDVRIAWDEGTIFNNFTIRPMVVDGTTPIHSYSNYFEGLRSAKCTELVSYGENNYTTGILIIPEELRNFLEVHGYGQGVNDEYYNYIDFERKVFVQNTYLKVFDGTEDWRSGGSSGNLIATKFTDIMPSAIEYQPCLSNALIGSTNRPNSLAEGEFCVLSNDIYIRKESVTNPDGNATGVEKVDNFKAWLSANPLTVIYVRAEPIETDISEYLLDDTINVEGGGTITAVNEYNYDLPTETMFLINTVGG